MVEDKVFVSDSDVPAFKELKTVQIAALLAKRNGGAIDLYKLIKLMYLIDRRGLEKFGDLVTFDRPFNMPFGPVLSNTYDLACEKKKGEYWSKYFSYSQTDHIVRLKTFDVDDGELSEMEIELMNDVFKKYGNMNFQELKEYTHSLPEFEESGETSTPISWTTLFNVTGWDGEDLMAIKDEMRVMLFYDKLIG